MENKAFDSSGTSAGGGVKRNRFSTVGKSAVEAAKGLPGMRAACGRLRFEPRLP
jgi:hypothetical protein